MKIVSEDQIIGLINKIDKLIPLSLKKDAKTNMGQRVSAEFKTFKNSNKKTTEHCLLVQGRCGKNTFEASKKKLNTTLYTTLIFKN